ncbi:MAG: tetratricopeptide repeat protein [Gaiellaceae bacterium]
MGDRLRPTWDFDDLDGSQQRFRASLEEEQTDAGRAEILTQLARVEGLRDHFDEGDALLDEAEALAGSTPVVRARVDLERGRLRRSGDDPEAALPLFEAAFETALAIPDEFLAVDAAHMVAIAAPDFETRLTWSKRGIDLAGSSSDPEVTYWLGSLFNNIGWDYFDAGDYETALDWFERALVEREKRPDEPNRIELAREAVEEARSKLQSSPPA